MTSKELLYVKTIAEEKSISQAAKLLFIAQPSLSQALSRIEDNLGTPLFTRTTGGLNLTYAGERYYQTACRILKIYENLEGEISDINGLRTGRIRMGITNHLGTVVLPKILPPFRRQCPFIELEILEETTDKLENRLLSGQLDFALMHAPKEDSHPFLNYEFLANDPFVIAMAPNHPLASQAEELEGYIHPVLDPRLLRNEPFIMLHKGQRIRHITDSILKKARIEPKIALTLKKMDQVKDAVVKDETPKTVWQTTKLVYGIKEIPEDGEDFIVMKSMISKTFSCLEYLYEQELVQRDYRDGRLYYGKM